MPYLVDATRKVIPNSGMECEDLGSMEEPEITWKTHEYLTKSQESRFCCFSSGIRLDAPLTDRVTWKQNVTALMPFVLGHQEDNERATNSEKNIKQFQEEALRTTTFPERVAEAKNIEGLEFLEPFLDCYDVETFLEKYLALPYKQRKLLKKIIGGNKALKIIKDLKKEIEKLLAEELLLRVKRIENTLFPLGTSLVDFFTKIKKIEESQIRNSFRYFESKKVFGKKGFIFFNGVSLQLPDLSKITKKEQTKEEAFYEWLRESITTEITKKRKLKDFIMRCLSFNAFAIADTTLRENCSSLFQFEFDFPKLQLNSRVGTRYFVNFNEEDETYEIVQMKNYTFRVRPSDETRLDYDIGSINVCWRIKINSRREIISGELFLRDITFCEDTDLQTRLDILRKMDME